MVGLALWILERKDQRVVLGGWLKLRAALADCWRGALSVGIIVVQSRLGAVVRSAYFLPDRLQVPCQLESVSSSRPRALRTLASSTKEQHQAAEQQRTEAEAESGFCINASDGDGSRNHLHGHR